MTFSKMFTEDVPPTPIKILIQV